MLYRIGLAVVLTVTLGILFVFVFDWLWWALVLIGAVSFAVTKMVGMSSLLATLGPAIWTINLILAVVFTGWIGAAVYLVYTPVIAATLQVLVSIRTQPEH